MKKSGKRFTILYGMPEQKENLDDLKEFISERISEDSVALIKKYSGLGSFNYCQKFNFDFLRFTWMQSISFDLVLFKLMILWISWHDLRDC